MVGKEKICVAWNFFGPQQGKEESSFCEEKEAKRLFPFEAEPP
jgi:hypothetical protein